MRPKSSSHAQKEKPRKGLWSPEEDEKLYKHITSSGVGCWSVVPKQAGLQRCGKSCRLRWINYLRPDLKRGNFTQLEEDLIIRMHEIVGNRWSQIAAQLPGRTDNEIKNYWNSNLKKKLKKMGIDPNTHKPLIVERKLDHQQEEREQHFHTPPPSKPPRAPFNPFPVFESANTGLYNQFQFQFQGSTVSNSDTIPDTFFVPNLSFSDDDVSGLSTSYANGPRETPSNLSSSNIVQENVDEYTSLQSMLATSLDEMLFELELNHGDFF